jgi:hypothetical protein
MSNLTHRKMKNLTLSLLLVLLPAFAIGQNTAVEKLFDKYGGKDGFTTVTINKSLFKMVSQLDDQEDLQALSGIESIKILAVEDESEVSGVNFYKEVYNDLKVANYEELMTVNSSESDVVFLAKQDGDTILELLLLVGGKGDDNALIYIAGKIKMNDVAKIAKSMGVDDGGKMHVPGL